MEQIFLVRNLTDAMQKLTILSFVLLVISIFALISMVVLVVVFDKYVRDQEKKYEQN